MKIITIILILFTFTLNGIAQGKGELSKPELKAIKKQAKKFEKEGWKVRPGQKAIELQLIRSYQWENEVNDDLTPKWMIIPGNGVSKSYEVARYVALNSVQSEFVRRATYEMTAEIKRALVNKDGMPETGAESVAKLQATESAKSIGQISDVIYPLTEMERNLPNGNIEVNISFATSGSNFKEVIKNGVNQALERFYKERNVQTE